MQHHVNLFYFRCKKFRFQTVKPTGYFTFLFYIYVSMSGVETSEDLKCYMLLIAIIFHYHGLDEEEEVILNRKASENGAFEELNWAYEFIAEDYITAFDRARDHLMEMTDKLDKAKRLKYINDTWIANGEKGYITEMEATAMLKLARDWGVDKELVQMVQKNSAS